jgi:hypothetical protein
MNSRPTFLLVFLFLFCCNDLFSQRPSKVIIEGKLGDQSALRAACPGSDAGTFKINRNAANKSNNIKYLCFGDRLSIVNNRDSKFGGDPKPNTVPGIGYIFYDCKPTVDGPNLASVVKDKCINKTSPILINGLPVNQSAEGLWIAKGNANGDLDITNDGFLQGAYNNGKPVQFWFAPVTMDQFSLNAAIPVFEVNASNEPGACISVRIDSAFSIVYLNQVLIANVIGTNGGMNNYTGTFTVTGGLPEFDTSANYTRVSIVNKGDPNKIGKLTNGPAKNGKPMSFNVPTPGKYDITIEDVNGCSTTTTVTIDENPGIIKVGCADGKVGDEICYSISIGQIPDLTSTQFTIAFNTQSLQYTGAKNLDPVFGDVNSAIITNEIDKGYIKFFWFDFNLMPHDFSAVTQVVQLCFKIKGPPGQSIFRIVPTPGGTLPKLELSNLDGNPIPLSTSTGSVFECISTISPSSDLDVFYTQCGQTLFGQVFGGKAPYEVSYRGIVDTATKGLINVSQGSLNSAIFSNLPGGKYELKVVDALNATTLDTFNFDATAKSIFVDLSNYTNPTCKGGDGRITAIPLGGTPAFTYQWSNGAISPTISQLATGKYTVTITDNSGCKATDSITLSKQDVRSAIAILNLPTCTGMTDGSVQADFNKILPPGPTLKWIGSGNQIGNRYTSLGKGPVGLIVSDAKGCSDTAFVTLGTQKELTADVTKDSVQCFNANDGRITILNRRFTNGDPLTNDSVFITTPLGVKNYFPLAAVRYNNIGVGTYPIYIKDQSGCEFRDTAIITQPAVLDTAKVTIKPESCFPGNDGSISITMTGGTAPYKFTWSGFPKDTNARVNLTQGSYSVIITDKKGCQTNFNNLSFPFSRPVIPVSIDTTAILCFGQGATLTARTDPKYSIKSYTWSNGDSTISAKNVLANKPAWVEVTDIQGCKGSDTIVLSQPSKLRLTDSTILNSTCPGLDQGIIRLSAAGGTGPYLFALGGGPAQNFGQFSRLKSGKYTVTITDSNQCPSLVINTEIVEPPKIVGVFDTAAFRGVKCAGTGDCTGQARLLLSGGTDPLNRFRVRWQSNEVTENSIISTADSLCAGNQQVTVTDGNGCNTVLQFSISSPTAISRDPIRSTVQDIACAGLKNGSVNYVAFGGTSPYTYLWNDNDTNSIRSGLAAGKYSITVKDLNNCTFLDSIKIAEPLALMLSVDSIKTRPITCPGTADGQIGIKAIGGNSGRLIYSWTPNYPDSNFIRNVKPGLYTVIVTDIKGCKDSLTNISMLQPPPIIPLLDLIFTPRCANDTAGVFIASVSGGNGASYSYAINNGTSIPIANRVPLKAGSYQLTVFDRKGCAVDTTIKVIDPPTFNIDLGPDKKIRLGDSIIITAIGNNPLSKVNWQNAGEVTCLSADCSIASLRPVRSTVFTGTALDQSGCKATDQIAINVDERRSIYIPNAFRPDQLSANQDFRLFSGSGVIAIHYGRIFNRWGDVVSEVQNLPPDPGGVVIWDGRFRGGAADPGVYVYAIDVEFSDGVRLVYKGDVTLIR